MLTWQPLVSRQLFQPHCTSADISRPLARSRVVTGTHPPALLSPGCQTPRTPGVPSLLTAIALQLSPCTQQPDTKKSLNKGILLNECLRVLGGRPVLLGDNSGHRGVRRPVNVCHQLLWMGGSHCACKPDPHHSASCWAWRAHIHSSIQLLTCLKIMTNHPSVEFLSQPQKSCMLIVENRNT